MQNSNAPQQQPATAQQLLSSATTLKQKMNILQGLAIYPAMVVMLFMRKKLGYRFISPERLIITFILVYAVAGISTIVPTGTHTVTSAPGYGGYTQTISVPNGSPTASLLPLILLAFAVLITGIVRRIIRYRDIKRGNSWFTQSRGVSYFNFLPLSDTAIKRFVDPAAALIVGLILSLFPFHFLGYFIIFCAVSLFIFEAIDFEKSLDLMLDMLDNLIEGETQSDNIEYYSQPHPTERPIEQTAGIPTGVAPDIAAQIQKRRNRKAGVVFDNLVTPAQPPAIQQGGQQWNQQPRTLKQFTAPQQVPFTNGQQRPHSTDQTPTHPLQYEQPRQQVPFTNGQQWPPQYDQQQQTQPPQQYQP